MLYAPCEASSVETRVEVKVTVKTCVVSPPSVISPVSLIFEIVMSSASYPASKRAEASTAAPDSALMSDSDVTSSAPKILAGVPVLRYVEIVVKSALALAISSPIEYVPSSVRFSSVTVDIPLTPIISSQS